MDMKLFLVWSAMAALTLPCAVAEDKPIKTAPEDTLAAAHEIIDRMVIAIGGEEAIKKITSRVATGEMSMPAMGIKVTMKVSQKAPDKVRVEQEIPGLMKATQGYDGTKGWSEDGLQGFREIEGAELEQIKREANLTREITMKEEFPVMKRLEDEKDGDRTLQVIEAISKDERKETWYFDAATGLLAKMQQKMSLGPGGELDVTIILKEYQDVDGVKIPFVNEVVNPAFKGVLTIKDVKHNVELDDKIFAAPSDDES